MERCGVIYALSLDGHTFRYVGMTKLTPERRLKGHVSVAANGMALPVYHWMRKHGPENIVMTVLDRVPLSSLRATEKWFIELFFSQGYKLLNLTDGGDGGTGQVGRRPSAETRARMSEAAKRRDPSTRHVPTEEERAAASARFKGVPLSEEHKAKMSAAKLGTTRPPFTEEHRANIAAARVGKTHHDGTKAKISASKKGRPMSDAHKEAIRRGHERRRVAQQAEQGGSVGKVDYDTLNCRSFPSS